MPPNEETVKAVTRKLEADAKKSEAEALAALALVEKHKADAEVALALAEDGRYRAAHSKIDLDREQRKEVKELACDEHHFVYSFTDSVNSGSVRSCISQLTQWSRNKPGCAIEIIFNSPGGSVIDGMALFDYILSLRRKGHYITTTAFGYAASMAGILLQVGDVRRIGREAYILIHEVSFGASGKIGEVEDEVKFVRKIQKRVLDIFADRCKMAGTAGTAVKPLSRKQIEKGWTRRDWWLDSDEALRGGVVDEVL